MLTPAVDGAVGVASPTATAATIAPDLDDAYDMPDNFNPSGNAVTAAPQQLDDAYDMPDGFNTTGNAAAATISPQSDDVYEGYDMPDGLNTTGKREELFEGFNA